MATNEKGPRKVRGRRRKANAPRQEAKLPPNDSRRGVALTVGWTVSVTTVLLCDVAAAAAHLYYRSHPDARGVGLLCELLLLAGAVFGAVSLAVLPIAIRFGKTPPPSGLAAFSVCAAVAPMLAIALKSLQ
ncbi:MAG: hypothetical protein AAF961_06440 [Planctomycetota bacterium]